VPEEFDARSLLERDVKLEVKSQKMRSRKLVPSRRT